MHGLQLGDLFEAVSHVTGKPRHAGTENEVHFLLLGIRHHSTKSVTVAEGCARLALIAINLLHSPERVVRNFLFIVKGLVFNRGNLVFAGSAHSGVDGHHLLCVILDCRLGLGWTEVFFF